MEIILLLSLINVDFSFSFLDKLPSGHGVPYGNFHIRDYHSSFISETDVTPFGRASLNFDFKDVRFGIFLGERKYQHIEDGGYIPDINVWDDEYIYGISVGKRVNISKIPIEIGFGAGGYSFSSFYSGSYSDVTLYPYIQKDWRIPKTNLLIGGEILDIFTITDNPPCPFYRAISLFFNIGFVVRE